jgi:mannose-6-phosphate isomerase
MRKAGEVRFFHRELPFYCYELPLTADCALLPLTMHPAFRGGKLTPWGGEKLRTVYGKPIAEVPTGESLEVSCIPGLESTDDTGVKLPDLIARYGARFAGKYAEETFPLLLKFIDAAESLSVQVHPDDAYAAQHENKLGKTEAWVILHAQEGASILYGMEDSVTIDELSRALTAGEDIEPMIHRVPVKAGDVYYMPSGMVHAIGGGIVLYEIQQSSDVTYRLWDFNRVNEKGEKRPLHIRQSLDVIDPALKGQLAQMPEGGHGVTRLLNVPAFKLDCACVDGVLPLENRGGFVMLTPLDAMTLLWEGAELPMPAGMSVLLPAACPQVSLSGKGRALLSSVK